MITAPIEHPPGWAITARAVGNVINLSTPLGLLAAQLGGCSVRLAPRGMVIADGYALKFPYARAFCVGNVLIFRQLGVVNDPATAEVLAHEEAHSWQWLAFGPLFLPLYTVAMGWSWLRTGDRGAAHPFERWAGLEQGGYQRLPLRPVRAGVKAASQLVAKRLTRLRRKPRQV